MIPRKKKKVIIIVSIIILLIIMTISLILLYINTDLFRSNATLFAKYFGQNVENIDTIYQKMGESELNQIIKQNKYTTKTQVKMNYIEGRGTTSENTQNSINQLKLNIEGQTDKNNQYNYQDIHLVKNDKKLAEVEYLQDGNTHGIRFSDLFSQYVVADNENLKNLLKKINDDEESLKNIPDRIEFGEDLKKSFQLSLEEKQNLRTNYVNLINLNVTKDKFSKQANQTIQINGKSINVNAYSVTLTKEQMNNLIIKMLEQIKQDEIILTRIDKIQMLLLNNQTKNLKEEFITNINNRITSITRNNIGQEEAKIIVYENNQKTIKTVIENEEYEISIDVLPQQEQNYLQISYRDSEIEQAITYNDTKTEQNINLKNIEGDRKSVV